MTYIEKEAFGKCELLTEILVDTTNIEEFKRIKGLLPENLQDKVLPKNAYMRYQIQKQEGIDTPIPSLIEHCLFALKDREADVATLVDYKMPFDA